MKVKNLFIAAAYLAMAVTTGVFLGATYHDVLQSFLAMMSIEILNRIDEKK